MMDFDIPAQADREWSRGCVSLLQESSALNDEIDRRLDPSVDQDVYSRTAREARMRTDGMLQKWRALARPQDPHFIEADRLFESALTDLPLLESYAEKFQRAGDLVSSSKLLARNGGGL